LSGGEYQHRDELEDSTVLMDRASELNTSFTGRSFVYKTCNGNFAGFSTVTGTAEGELTFTQDEGNDLGLEVLLYSLPLAS